MRPAWKAGTATGALWLLAVLLLSGIAVQRVIGEQVFDPDAKAIKDPKYSGGSTHADSLLAQRVQSTTDLLDDEDHGDEGLVEAEDDVEEVTTSAASRDLSQYGEGDEGAPQKRRRRRRKRATSSILPSEETGVSTLGGDAAVIDDVPQGTEVRPRMQRPRVRSIGSEDVGVSGDGEDGGLRRRKKKKKKKKLGRKKRAAAAGGFDDDIGGELY